MKISSLMEQGIGTIMKTAGRFYLRNSAGRTFLANILPSMHKQARIRTRNEEQGRSVPAFLIASIASQCNLRCVGCYARAGGCVGESGKQDLDTDQWRSIFSQASELGVSFILLAGGEPLLRREIVALASEFPNMMFPVFTNGTVLDEEAIRLLYTCRNLVPILSIEGGAAETDSRRGNGTYAQIQSAIAELERRSILFGVSITVTNKNLHQVTDVAFATSLYDQGCGLVLYVEYVPTEENTEHLVLTTSETVSLQKQCAALKNQFDRMIVLSFPGDEQAMGGCLASGRGFFHISPDGDAQPCPFSPYAKHNLLQTPMKDVLASEFFQGLREIAQCAPHEGGCTLFYQQTEVQRLLNRLS